MKDLIPLSLLPLSLYQVWRINHPLGLEFALRLMEMQWQKQCQLYLAEANDCKGIAVQQTVIFQHSSISICITVVQQDVLSIELEWIYLKL